MVILFNCKSIILQNISPFIYTDMDFPKRFTTISFVFIAILTGIRINAQETKQIHGHDMPKNIILLIGDGMGISHIQAGLTANFGKLNLLQFTSIGFSMTQPANE